MDRDMIKEKLANEITSAAREKLASWEKNWILNRRKQGLPEPTVGDLWTFLASESNRGYIPSYPTYNTLTSDYDSAAMDRNRAEADARDMRIQRNAELVKSKNFSPEFSKKYKDRINRLIYSPHHRPWADDKGVKRRLSLFMEGLPRGNYREITTPLREAMQNAGHPQRELREVMNFLEPHSQPLTKLIRGSHIKDKFFKGWSPDLTRREFSKMRRDGISNLLSRVFPSGGGTNVPDHLQRIIMAINEAEPNLFFTHYPEVAADYLEPGGFFQVGNHRHIAKADPRAFYTPHLSEDQHAVRLSKKLRKKVVPIWGRDPRYGELPYYESTTAMKNLLNDPTSEFHMVVRSPQGKLGPQQLLNRTKAISIPKLQEVAPKLQKLLRGLANKPLRF